MLRITKDGLDIPDIQSYETTQALSVDVLVSESEDVYVRLHAVNRVYLECSANFEDESFAVHVSWDFDCEEASYMSVCIVNDMYALALKGVRYGACLIFPPDDAVYENDYGSFPYSLIRTTYGDGTVVSHLGEMNRYRIVFENT